MAAVQARSKLTARDLLLTDTASSSSVERDEVDQPNSSSNLPVGAEIGIGLIIGILTCTLVLAILLLISCIRKNRIQSLAEKDPPVLCVNEEDNPRPRRLSRTHDFEIHLKSPNDERSHAMSQHRWTSPDDVAPRYEPHEQQGRQRDSLNEIPLENFEEPVDRQNRQYPNLTSHVYSNAGEEMPSYSSHHDSYESWTNSPSSVSPIPSYKSSPSSQQQQEQLVHPAELNPTPSHHHHHHQQEVCIPRQEPIKIQQPIPSYNPWRNHRLLNRTYSTETVQQIPNRDESRSQLETKEEVEHVANKQIKVKRGNAAKYQSATNSEPPKTKRNVKATPRKKTRDKTPRQNSVLTKTSNLHRLPSEHSSTIFADPKTNLNATNQDQNRERDQMPHPLQSHPHTPIQNDEISKFHTKENPLPSPPTQHPMIHELEGSEQKFL
ncbi:hypothetical protein ACHAO1_004845 [Botrytis cinerea]